MRNKIVFAVLCLIIITAISCANPLRTQPTQAPANLETIVAETLSALTAPAIDVTPPALTPSLLPNTMYYLGYDAASILQVFRLEKDGSTKSQITFEPADVQGYDVFRLDGSVVFVSSNNQLVTIQADGSKRTVIYDAGLVDANKPYDNQVSNPVWSPDGKSIAFGHQGLRFSSINSGQNNLVLENEIRDLGNGTVIPARLIRPEKYSKDGSKLILSFVHYEGATTVIYYLNGGAVVKLTGEFYGIICCGNYAFNNDDTALYAGSSTFGMYDAGLWRVDTSTGTITTLLAGSYNDDPINLVNVPFIAPDNKLYFFYASVPANSDFVARPPLQIVRSEIDGITNRTVLRPETFNNMNEALWSLDGSFVIIANAEIQSIHQGGAAQLYYLDDTKAMIPLTAFARNMKWGP